jgi:hypothetical protein
MTTATYRGVQYNVEDRHRFNTLSFIRNAIEKDQKLHDAAIDIIKKEFKSCQSC